MTGHLSLARIITFVVLTHAAFGAARVTSSLYALSNRASTFTVGVVMALFALVPALLAVRAGRWLDRAGPYRPLLLGTALMTSGALLPALFPYATADVAPLLVAAALLGTGFMYVQMTAQNLVGVLADPARRPAAFSMLALGFSTSGLIAPVTSGFMIDAIGHRATFAAVFVLLATSLALLYTQRRRLPGPEAHAHARDASDPFELMRHPDVRAVLIVSGLISMGWDMQSFLIPVYGNSIGLAASQIGLVLGSFAAATFTIRLAMPALARRYREWQVLLFTLLVSATAFALMPLFKSMVPLMAVAFLLGLGLGSAQPNVMSLLHDRSPKGRVGEALGLRTTIMNSSHVVLPLVIGAFGSVLGAAAGFWMMAVALGGGGWSARRRLRLERPHRDRSS
ncbi:MAG TPA: MFS transporter [Burkholderiaceae bacterium]|nr:MFS transporter [Burkholderiaceae bacterium]